MTGDRGPRRRGDDRRRRRHRPGRRGSPDRRPDRRPARSTCRGSDDVAQSPRGSPPRARPASCTARGCAPRGCRTTASTGRPVIGIANSWSELTPCNIAPARAGRARQARGLAGRRRAVRVPDHVAGRAADPAERDAVPQPHLDGPRGDAARQPARRRWCCWPAATRPRRRYLMGAASVDLPTILMTGGPMLNGKYRGTDIGSGTVVWRLTEAVPGRRDRRGRTCRGRGVHGAQQRALHDHGHGLDHGLPDRGAGHAAARQRAPCRPNDARRTHAGPPRRPAHRRDGRRGPAAVAGRSPATSFENAIRANAALGGSTNAVVHLLALAGRLGVPLALDDFDRLGRDVPTLVDLMPSGPVPDGGLLPTPAACRRVVDRARRPAATATPPTVSGRTLGENYAGAECFDREVIRPLDEPLKPAGSRIAVLRGNLAPNGAVIKQSAATPELMQPPRPRGGVGRIEDYHGRSRRPGLRRRAERRIVIRGCGPEGLSRACRRSATSRCRNKLLAAGRARHGADLRRADERHGLRHGGPARRARGRGRRAAGAGRATATSSCSTSRRRRLERRGGRRPSWERRRAEWSAPRPPTAPTAATSGSTSSTSRVPTRAPTSTSSAAPVERRSRGRRSESSAERPRGRSDRRAAPGSAGPRRPRRRGRTPSPVRAAG